MTEEVQEAQTVEVQPDTAVESPTTETTDSPAVAEDQETAQTQAPEISEQESEPQKETRAERRIKSLVDKLKSQETKRTVSPQRIEPLIRPDEYENGVDPQTIETRERERWLATSSELKNQVKQELAYEQSYNAHLADAEKVSEELKDNPGLDDLVATQYDLTNRMLNPYTGEYIWAPVATMSEVRASLEAKLQKLTTRELASQSATMVRQAAESAVMPSTSTAKQDTSLEELQKNLVQDPGAVRRALEKRLSVAQDD